MEVLLSKWLFVTNAKTFYAPEQETYYCQVCLQEANLCLSVLFVQRFFHSLSVTANTGDEEDDCHSLIAKRSSISSQQLNFSLTYDTW